MDLLTSLKFDTNCEISINHSAIIPDKLSDGTASTIWPSSIFLALFLKINLPKNEPQTILELGAGLGLTALITIKFCNIERYFLQEWPDNTIIELLEKNLSLSNKNKYHIITGKWGNEDLIEKIKNIDSVNELILADCFYNKKYFIPLLSTISCVLKIKRSIKRVICIYHHRNVNDSIAKYLPVFDLDAKILTIDSNLTAEIEKFKLMNTEIVNSKLLDFQDLFIIEFKLK